MKRVILLMSCFLLFSCNNYEDAIIDYAENKYGKNLQGQVIDLKEIFPFDWDKLYIFPPLTDSKDISEQIGFDCHCNLVDDDHYYYVFIKNNKIVGEKSITDHKIDIENIQGLKTDPIEANTAKFKIKRLNHGGYWLYKD